MSSVIFSINDSDYSRLQESIAKYGEKSESVLNQYLKSKAFSKFGKSIEQLIPVSARKKTTHARFSNPLQAKYSNLAITISNTEKYYYLSFPNDGTGSSRRWQPLNFMSKGVEKETETVVDEMINELNKIEVL